MNQVPASTYRLQISQDFTLAQAAEVLPYLHELGVDWIYLSPLLKAETGSNHGYDVIDHHLIDPSRGGAEAFAALAESAHALGMGVLVDIVPNHMGVATPANNAWWWDLLTHGQDSAYAQYFDVDWPAGEGKLRIPVLGDADVDTDGQIAHLEVAGDELHYYDNRYPIAPGTAGGSANEVHARQHYELVNWRRADAELNYRRFFAVNTLAAITVEREQVFTDSHHEIARWFEGGLADGLRVDHPDGLRDPAGYLRDLAGVTGGKYTLVEKILEPGEALDSSWATAGTTGYDALGQIDRVLTDPAGEAPLTELELRLRGETLNWDELIHHTKRNVADGILNSEVNRLVRELTPDVQASAATQLSPDTQLSYEALADAVAELLTCFPVYRSYLPDGREHLRTAFTLARTHRADLAEVLDAVEPYLADPEHPAAQRFQQTSGMVMAKGVEDCAFYRFARLTSLNEVGGDPHEFALAPLAFHEWAAQRQQHWPHAMTTTSTHDTKRGEDTRARITALAEIPAQWGAALEVFLQEAPQQDAGFAVLLWQAILGAWDDADSQLRSRLHAYAEKAMREAGEHTEWTAPNELYEASVHAAVDAAFDHPAAHRVLMDLLAELDAAADANSLSQKLLALTLPGVPDVYQGSEIVERSLVDPDNRRPVDFNAAAAALATGESLKQVLTAATLRLRRAEPERFNDYEALAAEGSAAKHLLAFNRGGAITAVTRLPLGLAARGGWEQTSLALPEGTWQDAVSCAEYSGSVRVAELLAQSPAALLSRLPD